MTVCWLQAATYEEVAALDRSDGGDPGDEVAAIVAAMGRPRADA